MTTEPIRELMKRAKAQGLWPVPQQYWGMDQEAMFVQWSADTGHAIKYLRRVYNTGLLARPQDRPPPIIRVYDDDNKLGKGRFKAKPSPCKRKGLSKSKGARVSLIIRPMRGPVEHTTIRSNAGQLARTAKDHAPVQTNGKMNKSSRYNTMYSTGFQPPSRIVDVTYESPEKIKARKGRKRFAAE